VEKAGKTGKETMSTKAERHLERAALDCHRRGDTWTDFWAEHGTTICNAEPHSRQRFQRLIRRLLGLVVSGDTNGQPVSVGLLWGNTPRQASDRLT
jgi:hypothetical protein